MKSGSGGAEKRVSPRIPKTCPVEVQLDKVKLLGPSANVSSEGVYFLAEGTLPVSIAIQVDGKKQNIRGRVVRIGHVNEKTLGIAIQFDSKIDV